MNLFEGCHDQTLANDLTWLREPAGWSFGDKGLLIEPEPKTDFFRPYNGEPVDNACLIAKAVTGDFTAVTHVDAHLVGFGDAGALTVRADAEHWAKLCLERSPIGDVAVVSVVTRTWSDDANGELISSQGSPAPARCYLRITRDGNMVGMHYSLDGQVWRFVRALGLELPETVRVGVHAQAPFGGGVRATFKYLTLTDDPVKDFRSGE